MSTTRFTVGDVTIHRIVEQEQPFFDPLTFFPGLTKERLEENRGWMEQAGALDLKTGNLILCIQSYVLRTPHHTILIDTCVGNDKNNPSRPFWHKKTDDAYMRALAAEGLSVEDIDYVMCTHLHVDHVGWNTRLENGRWVPTFPKAKYVFHKREYDFWEAATARGENPPGEVWRMNCLPVVEAGQALLVDDDFVLDDTVTLTPTPGHSPCHCCVNIHSRGQRAVVTGDLMHHALQCREPDWSTVFDWDPAMAAQSRRRFLGATADTDTIVLPIHFPAPTAGRIEADGAARFHYRFLKP